MRTRCEQLLRHMIVGDEDLVLDEADPCVTVLKGYSRSSHVAAAANSLQAALKMLLVGLRAHVADEMLARLRAEALDDLDALVELGAKDTANAKGCDHTQRT